VRAEGEAGRGTGCIDLATAGDSVYALFPGRVATIDVTIPTSPSVEFALIPARPEYPLDSGLSIAVSGSLAAVATQANHPELLVYDIIGSRPNFIRKVATERWSGRIAASGRFIYHVSHFPEVLDIYDATTSPYPVQLYSNIDEVEPSYSPCQHELAVSGNHVYVIRNDEHGFLDVYELPIGLY
jgi:hypothetical protein